MYCNCGNQIEPARVELGLERCFLCASLDTERPVGRMIYSHKTAPEIQIMSKKTFIESARQIGSVSLKSEFY